MTYHSWMKELVKRTNESEAIAKAVALMASDEPVPVDIMVETGLAERELGLMADGFLSVLEEYEAINGKR